MYKTHIIEMTVTGYFKIRQIRKQFIAAVNYARKNSLRVSAEYSEKKVGFLRRKFVAKFEDMPTFVNDRILNWYYNTEETFKTLEIIRAE